MIGEGNVGGGVINIVLPTSTLGEIGISYPAIISEMNN